MITTINEFKNTINENNNSYFSKYVDTALRHAHIMFNYYKGITSPEQTGKLLLLEFIKEIDNNSQILMSSEDYLSQIGKLIELGKPDNYRASNSFWWYFTDLPDEESETNLEDTKKLEEIEYLYSSIG